MRASRTIALLAVLSALNSVIRYLGAGVAGVETAFALILISGYVLGARFGGMLGLTSLLVSAALGGGIGPWLPFQMIAAATVGFGAGLLPKPANFKLKLTTLIGYAIVSSYVYGLIMDLWSWPVFAGTGTAVSFEATASFVDNSMRFLKFELVSGGLVWDTGRAMTTSVLIVLSAKALITTLERAAIRA